MKTQIVLIKDCSGSMKSIATAALQDFNTTMATIRNAATREEQDTIVSVIAVGVGNGGHGTTRELVLSNPHMLRPLTSWRADGGTPLYDGIGDAIELFRSLPDYNMPDVSYLVMTTTDGEERDSRRYNHRTLSAEIKALQATGRWTFVFRVPKGAKHTVASLGVPPGNIQEWDTTTKGMEASTVVNTQAVDTFFRARSAGKGSSTVFYADATNVTASQVRGKFEDISSQISCWVVLPQEDKMEIKPFAEQRLGQAPFLKGAAFYQLTKVEARVQDNKMIIIRDKVTGHVYYGPEARELIGLPPVPTLKKSVRLHPGEHGNYDLFIQSTSINRKLVAGTQVLYWPKVGTGFTAADFPWLNNGQTNITPTMQEAAKVVQATSGMSPGSVTFHGGGSPKRQYFASRRLGRIEAKKAKKRLQDAGIPLLPNGAPVQYGLRWYIEV